MGAMFISSHCCFKSVFLNNFYLAYHRTKDDLFQAQTSRYLSEFEEISALGKGAYGKVFKVWLYYCMFS